MSIPKYSIKAHIQCVIEIPVDTWNGGMTDMDSLTEQIRKEGLVKLRKLMEKENGKVIGNTKVILVTLDER